MCAPPARPAGAHRATPLGALGRSGQSLASALKEAQAIRPQLDELDAILAELQERARAAALVGQLRVVAHTSSISEA